MSTGELLNVDPLELKFPFELKKQISCSLQLSNKTDNHVAFKVKTTNPKKYCVRPNTGLVMPRSTCDVIVTMQAQKEAPTDMTCKDKFLLQSVVVPAGLAAKDITPEMFSKQAGRVVEECKLKVIYLPPPQPPSPVLEEPDEGVSPKVSFTDGGPLNNSGNSNNSGHLNTSGNLNSSANLNTFEKLNTSGNLKSSGNLSSSGHLTTSRSLNTSEFSRKYVDSDDNSSEVRSLISELTEEKNVAVHKINKIRQEMEMLMRGGNKIQGGGVPIIFVIAIALIGLVIGYLVKN